MCYFLLWLFQGSKYMVFFYGWAIKMTLYVFIDLFSLLRFFVLYASQAPHELHNLEYVGFMLDLLYLFVC